MPELIYEVGGNLIAAFLLQDEKGREYRVGRDPSNDFCLSQLDGSVSSNHGLVRATGGGYWFTDRESTNGSSLQRLDSGDVRWEKLPGGREVPLALGDVLRLGEKTFLHFGDFLQSGSFTLAQRLVDLFLTLEREGEDEQQTLSAFLYRLAGIFLNILQAREGFVEVVAGLAGTEKNLRVSALRQRSMPHLRKGPQGVVKTLQPSQLAEMDTERSDVEPVSEAWVRAVLRKGTARRFNEEVGKPFDEAGGREGRDRIRNRHLCVPITWAAECLGVFYAARELDRGPGFKDDDLRRAGDLALLAGSVLQRLQARSRADPLEMLVGNREVREQIRLWRTNPTIDDDPVLITGERGTGKDLVARALHAHSGRAAGRLVAVNVSQFQGERLAPELFGTARGKFTGVEDSPGLFQAAADGTLFLDEIGEMAPEDQAKLLRAIENRVILPVGGTEEISVNARVICATNRDLSAELEGGRFRADLFDRIAYHRLRLRPVREFPPEERAGLFREILARRCAHHHLWGLQDISDEAMAILEAYPWLGNVRQVERELGQAALAWSYQAERTSTLLPRHLSRDLVLYQPDLARAGPATGAEPGTGGDEPDLDLARAVERVTRHHFQRALALAGGRAREAAELLGLNRKTFYRRAKEIGIEFPRGKRRDDGEGEEEE